MAETISTVGTVGISLTEASQNPFTITNTGVIDTSSGYAIWGAPALAWTVYNHGTVISQSGAGVGVELQAGGMVTNYAGALISGGEGGVSIIVAAGTVTNAGTINSTAGGIAVALSDGGSIVNTGTISGLDGVVLFGPTSATVTNAGTIIGSYAAIQLRTPGDRLIIDPGAVFIGNVQNEYGSTATLELASASGSGTLTGLGTHYSGFQNDTIDSGASWDFSGDDVIGGPSTFTDSGSLAIDGTLVNDGVFNFAGAPLTGTGTLINSGLINGIYLASGHLTNTNIGLISSNLIAVYATGGAVTNAGTISGISGIVLTAGDIGNSSSATIIGKSFGIVAYHSGVMVSNAGLITGHDGGGVYLGQGGTVSNAADGMIGGPDGVVIKGSSGATLINAGTISGAAKAVEFYDTGVNRLVIDPGAVFTGGVKATGSTNTLEMAAGGGLGTLTELGSQYYGFQTDVIDSGAGWHFIGTNLIGAPSTLTDYGTLSIDGSLTNDGLVDIAGGQLTGSGILINGGLILVSSATLSISNLVNDGQIVLDPSTMTVTDLNGTGSTTIEAGSTLQVTGSVSAGETIVFAGNAAGLNLADPAAFTGTIAALASGDTLDLTAIPSGDISAVMIGSGNMLQVTEGGTTLDLQLGAADNFRGLHPNWTADQAGGGTDITLVPCFCAGTRIAADHGEVAVEALKVGQHVLTLTGEAKPITWVGQRRIALVTHKRPEAVAPIHIERDAIADGIPHRDLFVSPDHAIFIDGMLISARQLVNGATIRQDMTWMAVEYFHIELDRHAILLAEGLPAESYLDTGNRGMFAHSRAPTQLHPDLTDTAGHPEREAGSCAPFVWNEASVRPVWEGLMRRAVALGRPAVTCDAISDPALHLLAGGRTLRPISVEGNLYRFIVPGDVSEVRLVSRTASPADTRPWMEDRRRLGVYVERVLVRRACGTNVQNIPVDHPALSRGWWPVEGRQQALRRWTDGDAVLPIPAMDDRMIVEIKASSAGLGYLVADRKQSFAA